MSEAYAVARQEEELELQGSKAAYTLGTHVQHQLGELEKQLQVGGNKGKGGKAWGEGKCW